MEELVKDKNAFIRPSASGETLGGVARKTRESISLCEACGFDTIIIETVGVGQESETVHSMVDFFLLLKIAGAWR
jgi:LAO/AO transport system kinase